MLAKVINFGRPITIPTYKGYFFLPRLQPVLTRDRKILDRMELYNKRDDVFLKIEVLEADDIKISKNIEVDFSKFPINELRSMAANKGIKNAFFMRKSELIEFLGGTNEGSDTIS